MNIPSIDFEYPENSTTFLKADGTGAQIPITILSQARFMAMNYTHPEKIRTYLESNSMAPCEVDRFFAKYQINPKSLLRQYSRAKQFRLAGIIVFLMGAIAAFQIPNSLVIDFGILGIGVYMMWTGRIPRGEHKQY